MLKEMLENVRNQSPLIHNITNYVTANDCANVILACGGSPMMSDDINEVAEITSICNGLNINIGTLTKRTVAAMLLAGRQANQLGHPVVLDPVGVGASMFRTETALNLLKKIRFAVIRGNISEIKRLAYGNGAPRGVDADASDQITKENLENIISLAKMFAQKTGAVIAITGAIDLVANQNTVYCIYNGHSDMSSITGTGCQLSAMITAYAASNPDHVLESVVAAVCAMGFCGEKAKQRLKELDGNASYRNYLIDAIYNLSGDALEGGANYEVR